MPFANAPGIPSHERAKPRGMLTMPTFHMGSRRVSSASVKGWAESLQATGANLVRDVPLMLAYNTAVGIFVGALTEYSFPVSIIFSQCIGFCIYAGVMGSKALAGQSKPGWASGAIGITLGSVLGFVLAAWLMGFSLPEMFATQPRAVLICTLAAVLFGALGTWHFHDAATVLEAQAEADAERLRRAEQDAAATHAELARLQAQIEPHFLFNTLSNIVGLVDTQPETARRMLVDLTALLRTSLARTRQQRVSLGDELQLLGSYLDIMSVRMGDRLQWRIEADEDARAIQLPPLLVQPLVENAIRHGLEPKTEGGCLAIRCRRDGQSLRIDVEDDGKGFATNEGGGIGLSNVRERLRGCYGEAASLALQALPGGGVRASIRVPMEAATCGS
jgi:sensor histidine kinase YesM